MNYLDEQGRYRVGSLFWEHRIPGIMEKYPPVWTLKDVPVVYKGSTLPSLKTIYLSYDHVPTCEYQFAMDHIGSWEHWKALADSATLSTVIAQWREELSVRLKCNAIKLLMDISRESTTAGLAAARYIADEAYIPKRVGRISKAEKEREIKIAAGVRDTLSSDMERLGLELVSGGK